MASPMECTGPVHGQYPTSAATAPSKTTTIPEGFPLSLDRLENRGVTLGGTFGTEVLHDNSTGLEYVLKVGFSTEAVEVEYQANQALAALGVRVAECALLKNERGLVHKKNSPAEHVLLMERVAGAPLVEALTGDFTRDRDILAQISRHLVTHAILGAPDFVGLCWNNILVTADRKVVFVDSGMAFEMQHNGVPKSDPGYTKYNSDKVFALETPKNVLAELFDILDAGSNRLSAGYCCHGIKTTEIMAQARSFDLEALRGLVDQGKLSPERYAILEARTYFLQGVPEKELAAKLQAQASLWEELDSTPPGEVPKIRSRGISLAAAKHGLNWPAVDDSSGPLKWNHNAEGPDASVKAIVGEVGSQGVYLVQGRDGNFTLPTAAPEERNQPNMWDPTCGLGIGGRLGVTDEFLADDQAQNIRVYSVKRAGGNLNDNMVFFSRPDEAVEMLMRGRTEDATYLISYLRNANGTTAEEDLPNLLKKK